MVASGHEGQHPGNIKNSLRLEGDRFVIGQSGAWIKRVAIGFGVIVEPDRQLKFRRQCDLAACDVTCHGCRDPIADRLPCPGWMQAGVRCACAAAGHNRCNRWVKVFGGGTNPLIARHHDHRHTDTGGQLVDDVKLRTDQII